MLTRTRSNRNTHSLLMKNNTATLDESLVIVTKLNILISYNPAIVLFGIYPKELQSYFHTKTCTQVFITALLIIFKNWKQPGCPSVGDQIKYASS